MDTEFINAYIQKQKSLIGDLQSKLLLVETQVDILNQTVAKLTEENTQLNSQLEKQTKRQAKKVDTTESSESF